MTQLSTAGRQRLQRLRHAQPDLSYSWEGDTWGADTTGEVALCVDQTSWVTDAKVASLPDDLRQPEGFVKAVREAYAAAELLRQMQSMALDRGPRTRVSDSEPSAPVQARLIDRPAPIERPTGPISFSPAAEVTLVRDRVYEGTSRYREVTARIRWNSGCVGIDVEPEWLRSTTPEEARFALKEAFRAAYTKGEDW